MRETQETINAWQRETFGDTTLWAVFQRMEKEYAELRDAIDQIDLHYNGGRDKARDEIADVYITLCRVAESLGCSIAEEVDRKMVVNRAREWIVDGTGNGQHK